MDLRLILTSPSPLQPTPRARIRQYRASQLTRDQTRGIIIILLIETRNILPRTTTD